MGEEKEPINKIEKSVNPEIVWGKEFRVPVIVGEGSGLGFGFSNLHLPRKWEESIAELKEINVERFSSLFADDCRQKELKPGEVRFDTLGVLREITVNTVPVSRVYLETEFPYQNEGLYESENIKDIRVAIIMQGLLAHFLNIFRRSGEINYSYIESQSYRPIDLKIPEKFLKKGKSVTNDYAQNFLRVEASNIAGRFGLDLRSVHFDEKGILTSLDVKPGNACSLILDSYGKIYYGHNIDTPYQGAALFGIGAAFINYLLDLEEYNK